MIVATANLKGGVGKSILAYNLAGMLSEEIRPLLVIDKDPLGTLHKTYKFRRGPQQNLFPSEQSPIDEPDFQVIHEPEKSLLSSEKLDQASLVIVDTAPGFDRLCREAYMVASIVIVPIQPTPQDISTSTHLVDLARYFQDRREGLPRVIYVLNRVKPRTAILARSLEMLQRLGIHPSALIPETIHIQEASLLGLPLVSYKPDHPAVRPLKDISEIILKEYESQLAEKDVTSIS